MKASPIQLIESHLEKISVQPNRSYKNVKSADVDHVTLQTFKRVVPAAEYWNKRKTPVDGIESRTFLITLGVRTPTDEKFKGPYVFEVICSGVVICVPDGIGTMSAERAAREYGLSLMYGQVRENVAALTARMRSGIHMLPTVSFIGDGEGEAPPKRQLVSDEADPQRMGETPPPLATVVPDQAQRKRRGPSSNKVTP